MPPRDEEVEQGECPKDFEAALICRRCREVDGLIDENLEFRSINIPKAVPQQAIVRRDLVLDDTKLQYKTFWADNP